jgi:selenocysteine lyase/cysteine desulfurase
MEPSMQLETIRQAVIGANKPFPTPFGHKPMVYADYTASGRSLDFIEQRLSADVMPWYANTHTEFSYSGAQTTRFREDARQIIHTAVNGGDDDQVIFCGAGATAAVNKLITILGIRLPEQLDDKYQFSKQIPEQERPVVFIGPYEHHSNELPWRESIATLVCIPEDARGQINLQVLASELLKYKDRPLKIGSFSAASNVTGICSDIRAIGKLLKQHNALSIWDYAAAAPYVKIDMNAEDAIDAVFYSPHKFVGGPGTPGVLVIKKQLMTNPVPAVVGGGTVQYVTPVDHRYISDPVVREEGGTPAILEAIRAGLVTRLQQDVGIARIEQLEKRLINRAIAELNEIPEIEILGNTDVERISIFSLRFKHDQRDLHHGYVTALLNDIFGIQVRGGCSCAGPYGHHLLDINLEHSRQLETIISQGLGVFKPGWVRFNLNYFISDDEFNYILGALKLVAKYGHRLLSVYEVDIKTGVWRYQGQNRDYAPNLHELDFLQTPESIEMKEPDYQQLLADGEAILCRDHSHCESFTVSLPEEFEAHRWFCLAQDLVRVPPNLPPKHLEVGQTITVK